MVQREQADESQEEGAGCNTLHRVTSLPCPLEAVFPEVMQRKEFTLICYSTTVDLSCVFGLGKKLLCDLSTEQD